MLSKEEEKIVIDVREEIFRSSTVLYILALK